MQKNTENVYINIYKVAFFTLTQDVTCSKILLYRENIGDKKLSVEHTLKESQKKFLFA